MKNYLKNLINLLCPPACAYCGKTVDGHFGLCVDCLAKYASECGTECPKCGQTAEFCMCDCEFSKFTKTRINGKSHVTLTFYTGAQLGRESGRITEKMILALKNKGQFASFFADELADRIERTFVSAEISLDEWMITYPPRSVSNFMKYGIDQGEEISKRLARRLKIPQKKTFVREEGSEQKSLNAVGRMENAVNTLIPQRGAIVPGGKYLLFDDIITSGATIITATRHLYFCGAAAVFPISIARDLPRKGLK